MNRESRESSWKREYLRCVWMSAGVIDFKLCDRQCECETCPLDAGMRGGARVAPVQAVPVAEVKGVLRAGGSDSRSTRGYHWVENLFYYPSHVWARVEEGGRLRVGLDDFAQKLTGRIYSVTLPQPGTRVTSCPPVWKIVHAAGESSLGIPIVGSVDGVNESLLQQPSLINRDPFGHGSVMVIRSDNLTDSLQGCLYGRRVGQWYEAETERLHHELMMHTESGRSELGVTLQDGGEQFPELERVVSPRVLLELIEKFLGPGVPSPAGEIARLQT